MHDTCRLELKTFFFFVQVMDLFALNRNPYLFSFWTISVLPHQVFIGNVDSSAVVQNKLKMPQITRWIRIVDPSWNNHTGIRVELYGC